MWLSVLGMHRSGTSAMAGVLHSMGLHFGQPEKAVAPGPTNPKGYWERTDVVAINDELLARIGCRWDRLDGYDPAKLVALQAPDLEEGIRRLLHEYPHDAYGFLKDPRLCLTLPFWQRVEPPVAVVWLIRHPLAVAQSLFARGDCSLMTGLALWEIHNRAVAAALNDCPCARVIFDSFRSDPASGTRDLLAALHRQGIDLSAQMNEDAIRQWFDEDLVHHNIVPDDESQMPQCVQQLWQNMQQPLGKCPNQPYALSTFSRESLRYHEKIVRKYEDDLYRVVPQLQTALADLHRLQECLSGLVDSFDQYERSHSGTLTRRFHRLWCLLMGQPNVRTPIDKIRELLRDSSS